MCASYHRAAFLTAPAVRTERGSSAGGKTGAWKETCDSEWETARICGCPCCWLWLALKAVASLLSVYLTGVTDLALGHIPELTGAIPYPDPAFKARATHVLDFFLSPVLQPNTDTCMFECPSQAVKRSLWWERVKDWWIGPVSNCRGWLTFTNNIDCQWLIISLHE